MSKEGLQLKSQAKLYIACDVARGACARGTFNIRVLSSCISGGGYHTAFPVPTSLARIHSSHYLVAASPNVS